MKILFITDNYPPEVNAPANRTFEHINRWKKNKNIKITVITCHPNFPNGKLFKGFKNKLFSIENNAGIKVIRVWTFIAPNKGVLKRILDFFSFAISSSIVGIFIKTDIIIVTSPQFFTTFSAFFLSKVKRIKWIFELRDLWPESIKSLNVIKSKFIISFLEKIELFLYKDSNLIIALTNSYKENLIKRGIDPGKIKIVPNGVDLKLFNNSKSYKPISYHSIKNFTIGYIGTIGLSHNLDFILRTISQYKINDIEFLFVGDGSLKDELIRLSNYLSLANVKFVNNIERKFVPQYYASIDVALVCLAKNETFKKVIPSKIFEACAMGKPILLGVEGEAKKLINKYNCGLCFKPNDAFDFKKCTYKLKDESIYKKYSSGCLNLANDYSRDKLAKRMLRYIYNNYNCKYI